MTIGIINQKARDKAYFGEILPWSLMWHRQVTRPAYYAKLTALWRHYDPPRCVWRRVRVNKIRYVARRLPCYAKCCVGKPHEMQQNPNIGFLLQR
jgi:hypothetical protein